MNIKGNKKDKKVEGEKKKEGVGHQHMTKTLIKPCILFNKLKRSCKYAKQEDPMGKCNRLRPVIGRYGSKDGNNNYYYRYNP